MITLEFSIDKQTMTREDNEKVVSNSSNIHQCHFSFSEDWNGKEISAIFYKGISTVAVMLDENNNCFIPTQLLKASYPVDIKVSCFGVEEDEIITSTLVDIPVLVGSSTSGASPEIAYNLFEQIMQRIDQVKKGEIEQELILEAVNDYLTEHPFDDVTVSKIAEYVTSHVAELKGEKGDKGDTGEQGLKGDSGIEKQIVINNAVTNYTIKPNILYVFPELAQLDVSFDLTAIAPDIVNDFHFQFENGASPCELQFPESVNIGDYEPQANSICEISIVNCLLSFQNWSNE